ncbi:MAG: VOC family protein [Nocardioidaceae bacterium]|nr:VOC family protein [Nocardioidaceae bacterium]
MPMPLSTARGVDHLGVTVPDLDQARRFFVDVLGCTPLYVLGPFADADGTWMRDHLGVAPDTVMRRLQFFELGGQAVFEVFEYEARDAAATPPLNSDVGGHHVAIYVDDLDLAVEELRAHGIRVLGEPTASQGPSAGQRWVYFLTPWGLQMELVSYPDGKAFHRDRTAFDRPG